MMEFPSFPKSFGFHVLRTVTWFLGGHLGHRSDFLWGFSGGTNGKEPTCQCRRTKCLGFDPWVGKIPGRRAWQLTSVFLPGETLGQRSLASYNPWGCKVGHDWVTEHRCQLSPASSYLRDLWEFKASPWFQQIPQSWLLYGSLIPCICRMLPLHIMIYITITPSSLLSLIPKKDPLSTHICWVYLLEVLLGRVT